jgi:hypothetical protein
MGEIRICLESGLLILAFYQFWVILSIKLHKIVGYKGIGEWVSFGIVEKIF